MQAEVKSLLTDVSKDLATISKGLKASNVTSVQLKEWSENLHHYASALAVAGFSLHMIETK